MNIYTVMLLVTCILSIGKSLGKDGQTEVIEHSFMGTLIGQLIVIYLILKATNII